MEVQQTQPTETYETFQPDSSGQEAVEVPQAIDDGKDQVIFELNQQVCNLQNELLTRSSQLEFQREQ